LQTKHPSERLSKLTARRTPRLPKLTMKNMNSKRGTLVTNEGASGSR